MSDLRKAESELDEGLRLGALLWPRKMAAELRRLHEENHLSDGSTAWRELHVETEDGTVKITLWAKDDRALKVAL